VLDALVIARDKAHQGGVVNFVELLIANFSSNVRATRFVIGRSPDDRSYISILITPLRDAIRLIRTVQQRRYDIIHINPSLNFNALVRDGLFIMALRATGAQNIVVFIHGWDESFLDKINKYPLARAGLRRLLRCAGSILVLARRFKNELCELGLDHGKIAVLTTMFDRKLFEGIQRCRRDSRPRLLFLSRLIKEKGIYELLAALTLLIDRGLEVELVIAGDGAEEKAVREWIRGHDLNDHVTMAGYLRGREKAKTLVDADIFVFPSYYEEGCPISLLEAMAAGLAIITTPIGGIPDFFIDGLNGILLKSLSAECIADAIEALIRDKDVQARIRAQNRQQSWERYEATRVTRIIEETYERVRSAQKSYHR
jgi:glycosyltransferase involved in cell wall biosynthesis